LQKQIDALLALYIVAVALHSYTRKTIEQI